MLNAGGLPQWRAAGECDPCPDVGIQSEEFEAPCCRKMNGSFTRSLWPDWSAVADGFGSFVPIDQRRLNGRSRDDRSHLWRQIDRKEGAIAFTWDSQSGDRFLLG